MMAIATIFILVNPEGAIGMLVPEESRRGEQGWL